MLNHSSTTKVRLLALTMYCTPSGLLDSLAVIAAKFGAGTTGAFLQLILVWIRLAFLSYGNGFFLCWPFASPCVIDSLSITSRANVFLRLLVVIIYYYRNTVYLRGQQKWATERPLFAIAVKQSRWCCVRYPV
jgi:hypothetical protein